MKLSLFGGTFDPVHNGHLYYARKILREISPDRLIIMPANRSPFKNHEPVKASHRLEMLRRAFKDDKRIVISTYELDKPDPSYTVDTIRYLMSHYQPIDRFYLLAGMDQAVDMIHWKEIDSILEMGVIFAVFPRREYERKEIHPAILKQCLFLDGPFIDISSSDIRDKIRRREAVKDHLPEEVLTYITDMGLYHHA